MHVVGVGEVLGREVQGDIMTPTPTLTLRAETTIAIDVTPNDST